MGGGPAVGVNCRLAAAESLQPGHIGQGRLVDLLFAHIAKALKVHRRPAVHIQPLHQACKKFCLFPGLILAASRHIVIKPNLQAGGLGLAIIGPPIFVLPPLTDGRSDINGPNPPSSNLFKINFPLPGADVHALNRLPQGLQRQGGRAQAKDQTKGRQRRRYSFSHNQSLLPSPRVSAAGPSILCESGRNCAKLGEKTKNRPKPKGSACLLFFFRLSSSDNGFILPPPREIVEAGN